jgi:hypothetical protein
VTRGLARFGLFRDQLDLIAAEVLRHPQRETGGSLFGHATRSGNVLAYRATGPGLRAEHGRESFYPDPAFMQRSGRALQPLEHVGEWHSHHRIGLREPSPGDVESLRRVITQRGWSSFGLGIANIESSREVSIGFWIVTAAGDLLPCAVEVLEVPSPFAAAPLEESADRHLPAGARVTLRPPSTTTGPWFTEPAVAGRLARELTALQSAGFAVASRVDGDEVALEVASSSRRWMGHLARGFPRTAPRIESVEVHSTPIPWDSRRLLAEHLIDLASPVEVPARPRIQQLFGLRAALYRAVLAPLRWATGLAVADPQSEKESRS